MNESNCIGPLSHLASLLNLIEMEIPSWPFNLVHYSGEQYTHYFAYNIAQGPGF